MVTPLEPLLQKITHRFYSSNSMLHPFGMLILLGEAIQVGKMYPLTGLLSLDKVICPTVGEGHNYMESQDVHQSTTINEGG